MNICSYLCDEDIFNILRKYSSSERLTHLQNVACYSDTLINLLFELYHFNESERILLRYSSLLHDIGYFINNKAHHKHSKYIILSDELLDKLPINERAILAVIVASHRKKLDKDISYYPKEKQLKIIQLIAILRLADALDFQEDCVLEEAYIDDTSLCLKLLHSPDIKALKKLSEKSELFKDTFKLNIKFNS